ncbi:MAG: hypothetical protein CMC00_00625 [Flavobacteriaceae bacterium]|jgi:uncharacterized membrane protein|nr:hypothetical protein [Flavobacteriaceae bacterium]|tara:strand:- start:1714 stop:2802 length:1089 start_codon:yes stop_codon:yes gene_type:complete
MIILSIYIGKTKLGKQFGAALLVILFTAVIANLKLIPSASNSIGLYNVIFKYVAPISIFYLLLNVNLNSIKKAGLPMISLFIIGSLATTFGILLSWILLSPETVLGNDAKIIAGMLTGTYTGGSVNFNAVALEYGFQKKGILYAGTIAVDNVVTALWILVTLILPMLLSRIWKSKIGVNKINSDKVKFSDKGINITSLAWLTFLGITSFYLSEILVEYFTRIPSILILTTIGIGLAQTKFVSNLNGSHDLGLYLVYLFLAVIGAYCEIGAVYQLKEIGITLLLFSSLAVLIHGILTVLFGGLLYRDWQMIAIVSQANVGGGASAIALAETFERNELILPAILVGTLGNALGTYLGFFVVYVL